MTLTDFLLARIAEREAVARAATAGPWRWEDGMLRSDAEWVLMGAGYDDGSIEASVADREHIALNDPAHVLAECEAKRRLVEMHEANDGGIHDRGRWDADAGAMVACRYWFCCICDYDRDYGYVGGPDEGCETLRTLALPYADHADYREAWRP